MDKLNTILSNFNDENNWLDKGYRSPSILNGVNIGISQNYINFSIELGYSLGMSRSYSSGFNPITNSAHEQRFRFRLNTAELLLGLHSGALGVGGGINFNRLYIGSSKGSDDYLKIVSSSTFGYQLHLTFKVSSNKNFGFSIRPFYKQGFNHFNIENIYTVIDIEDMSDPESESLSSLGISFIFSNGPQN